MKPSRVYTDYLTDILGAIENIGRFVEGMTYEQFAQDERTSYAVLHALEIIGEAAKKVPLSERNKYSGVAWREVAGMRDKLIHHYFGVNLVLVWKTVKEDLPGLEAVIRRMLAEAKE